MRFLLSNLLFFLACAIALAESPTAKSSDRPEIELDRSSSDIFPVSWLTPKVDAQAEPLAEADHERSRALVERALKLYPPAVLKAYLKKVYVVGRLQYHGVSTAGTRSANSVYLVVNDRYSTELAEKNLHAEFSSILFMKCPQHLDETAWRSVNPPGFSYKGSGVQAVKSGQASNVFNDSLHQLSFLNEYAQASLEEDFNSYAGRLLVGDKAIWKTIERFPKVKAKADLTMAVYKKLEAKFNNG